jgi:acyl-CoA reductase-like NAD-dependent aldehyde dehydrogenase
VHRSVYEKFLDIVVTEVSYGAVKDSGIGREGPRYSIRDMTEERMVLFNY